MSMSGGSVTVNQSNETQTGSGLALTLYLADKALLTLPALPVLGQTSAPFAPGRPCNQGDIDTVKAARLALLNEAARRANAYGVALVSYIQNNAEAEVTVHTTDAGLQRTPNPNDPSTATLGPSADKTLTGTVT